MDVKLLFICIYSDVMYIELCAIECAQFSLAFFWQRLIRDQLQDIMLKNRSA